MEGSPQWSKRPETRIWTSETLSSVSENTAKSKVSYAIAEVFFFISKLRRRSEWFSMLPASQSLSGIPPWWFPGTPWSASAVSHTGPGPLCVGVTGQTRSFPPLCPLGGKRVRDMQEKLVDLKNRTVREFVKREKERSNRIVKWFSVYSEPLNAESLFREENTLLFCLNSMKGKCFIYLSKHKAAEPARG